MKGIEKMFKLICLLNKYPKVSIFITATTKIVSNKNKTSNFFDGAKFNKSSIKPKKIITIKKSKK